MRLLDPIRPLARGLVLPLVLLPLAACGDSPTQIRGSQIGSFLAQVMVDGVVANPVPGEAPEPGSGPTAIGPDSDNVISGGSTRVPLDASDSFQTVAIKIDGVEGYYLAALPAATSEATMVLTIANSLPELSFDYEFAVAGPDGEFGAYSSTSVNALEVAGGDIQVSVTWSTLADVDLHVVDPTGEEIYYGNRSSASGGQLDLDANAACTVSNIFQENIGWSPNTAPSGEYIVRVDYWDACGETETEFVVTVNVRPGVPRTPITPGASLQTYTGIFNGPGSNGAAGDGTTIARFVF